MIAYSLSAVISYQESSGHFMPPIHVKEYRVMRSGSVSLSADEQEDRHWIASQRYMRGEITIEDLEKEELPHARRLREAKIALAKVRPELTPRTADEYEDHLWKA